MKDIFSGFTGASLSCLPISRMENNPYFCTFKTNTMKYLNEAPFSVTICDKEGKILEMNEKSVKTFLKDGKSIIGHYLFDCHPEPAKSKLKEMLDNHNVNVYSIEKNGIKKLIYQSPWYEEGKFMGYIELSLELPAEIPHYVRK